MINFREDSMAEEEIVVKTEAAQQTGNTGVNNGGTNGSAGNTGANNGDANGSDGNAGANNGGVPESAGNAEGGSGKVAEGVKKKKKDKSSQKTNTSF